MAQTQDVKKEAAERYWALKDAGTVEDLAKAYGVTKPTLLDWANKFPPQKKNGTRTGPAAPAVSATHKDTPEVSL